MTTASTPLILLTGFLGAGKTSLLNHMLGLVELAGKRIAIIVNEFGALGVDGALLRPGNYQKYEINKGSIFCICMKTDLIAVFNDIEQEVKPDLVLVEATGLAEPRDLASVLQIPSLAESFRVAANFCLVDPIVFPKIAQTMRTAVVQVREADVLVLNKCDLASEETLEDVTQQLWKVNSHAAIHRTTYGQLPAEILLKADFDHAWSTTPRTTPPSGVHSIAFRSNACIDREQFYGLLDSWGGQLLRAKGIVQFDDGRLFVQSSSGRVTASPHLPESLPDDQHSTAFVLITRDLDESTVLDALRGCESC